MVTEILRVSRRIMTSWLEEHYEAYRAELMRVTTIGHTVPFEDSF